MLEWCVEELLGNMEKSFLINHSPAIFNACRFNPFPSRTTTPYFPAFGAFTHKNRCVSSRGWTVMKRMGNYIKGTILASSPSMSFSRERKPSVLANKINSTSWQCMRLHMDCVFGGVLWTSSPVVPCINWINKFNCKITVTWQSQNSGWMLRRMLRGWSNWKQFSTGGP